MLKKAGIVVAAAAAGILALSPLAFAHNDANHHQNQNHSQNHHQNQNQNHDQNQNHHQKHDDEAVDIDYTNVERNNLTNDCAFEQDGGDIDQTVVGGGSVLGAAGLATGVVAPLTTQAQLLNCTNVGVSDVIDSGSGNETTTVEETEIEGSFNESIED